jgi:hypothetical protein
MLTAVAANNFGDTEEGALMGPMGLFIILLLVIATVLLIRNMNGRIRRLPDKFPDDSGNPGGTDMDTADERPETDRPGR